MPKIAIITRTLNRPILLRRAAKSILNQNFKDYCWVVINDGDQEPVEKIVNEFDQNKVILIHNPKPVGMEAAANMGLKASESEYVVIHDDDDTWHPHFLKKTISYLDSKSSSDIQQGVITHCVVLKEKISNNSIEIKEKFPFNTWMTEVSLYRMLGSNTFPPICFIYRRKVLKEIGYYDESIPVLGDWEFNIRFLLKYDIGLIPEILAYYHHREGLHTNTVLGDHESHLYYGNLLRNRYLRKDIEMGTIGAGFFMNIGRTFEIIFGRFLDIEKLIDPYPCPLKNFLDKIRKR